MISERKLKDSIDIVRLAVYNASDAVRAYFSTCERCGMEYMTIQEAATKWSISERRIQVLCTGGRLPGATKFGRQWAIPADMDKPEDARIKSGKYIKHNAAT